jgi:hypothetical protein
MAIVSFPQGLGELLGDDIVTCAPLLFNGDVWYVDSQTGDDSFDGRDRERPFATLGQAVDDSAAGDLIVCLSGHTETISSTINITDRYIVGAGRSNGKPTVVFTSNVFYMFTCNAADVGMIANVWIKSATGVNSRHISIDDTTLYIIRGCYVELGDGATTGSSVSVGVSDSCTLIRIEDTTYVSTATSQDTVPMAAILTATAGATMLVLKNVTVDGGDYGWNSTYKAIWVKNTDIINAENLVMLNGSDMKVEEATDGYINVQSGDGHTRIEWAGVGL